MMATSGSTNFNITARQLITYALKKINILGAGTSLQPEDSDRALQELNFLLKEWMIYPSLWRKDLDTITMLAPSISGITQASPAVVTTTAAHNLTDGNRIAITGAGGMTEINGAIGWVANKTSTTFEIEDLDASAYTAYTSGGTVLVLGYRLTSTNPHRFIEGRLRQIGSDSARDIPLTPMTWAEYFELPVKASRGIPTQCHFNPGRGDLASGGKKDPILYVWPVFASVDTETVEYTFQGRVEDVDSLDDNLDLGAEWFRAAGYNLAEGLMAEYGKGEDTPSGRIIVRMAAQFREEVRDHDRDDEVILEPETRYG